MTSYDILNSTICMLLFMPSSVVSDIHSSGFYVPHGAWGRCGVECRLAGCWVWVPNDENATNDQCASRVAHSTTS